MFGPKKGFIVAQALTIRDLSKRHNPEMFRATKGSGVTITTILRNNAIETRPGNKIHHLREKRSACVHFAPDWKTTIGEDVTSRILDRVQGATKKNTSETLVLQRYAEIIPSVNRTAVTVTGNPSIVLGVYGRAEGSY